LGILITPTVDGREQIRDDGSMKRMSFKQFCQIVREAIATLPQEIADHLKNVVIDVLEEPTAEQLASIGISDEDVQQGERVYGLFIPVPGIGTSDMDMLDTPNQILIFKKPLEEDFPDPEQLRVEIWKTLIHEVAHHFGFSEEDLDSFEANPNPFDR
jgi:predicted Zn-dependent protease with MMP-like domain